MLTLHPATDYAQERYDLLVQLELLRKLKVSGTFFSLMRTERRGHVKVPDTFSRIQGPLRSDQTTRPCLCGTGAGD